MANNDFLVWAGGGNANVLTQAQFVGLGYVTSGVTAGKASAQQANKVWRQASIMASMLGGFINARLNRDVTDDGTTATILTNFTQAIQSLFVIPNTGVVPNTYGPTVSITVQADGRVTGLSNTALTATGVAPGTYPGATVTVGLDGRITGISSVSYGPLASPNTWSATNTFQAGVRSTAYDSGGFNFRARVGNYGVGLRNDGVAAYLMQTTTGDQDGNWNAFRPFSWVLATGAVTIDGTGSGVTFGGNVTSIGSMHAGTAGINSSGNITTSGGLFAASGVSSTSGNITATGGYLRALLGAQDNPSDGNAAVIAKDFIVGAGAGTTGTYMVLPNHYIFQMGLVDLPADRNIYTFNFPAAFPHACISINASFGVSNPDQSVGCQPANNAQFFMRDSSNLGSTNGTYWIAFGF